MVTVHIPPPGAEEVMTVMARGVARLYGVKVTVKLESATGESNTVIDGRPQTPLGQVERGVRALDPERADFEAWVRGKDPEATDALWRDADDRDAYHYGDTQAAWEAWQAARAWVPMSQRKPKGGQLIVKRWRHGAVWAGTHNEGPKNEAFDEWKAL